MLYKVSPGGYIFIEPRYFDSRYSANYVGKDGKGQKTDNLFVLSAGARFYYNRAEERIKNDGYFLPHFWAGLGFGGVKNFDQIHRQQDGYGAFNPSINLNGGYDFNPYATLRLQADWQYFSRFKKDNYELFDITLDKKHVSNNSETKEQKFTELFYQSTEALVHDKLNM